MKVIKSLVMVLTCTLWVSCASTPSRNVEVWSPSESEMRTAFKNVRPPYKDAFANFAFTDGFISAYALGPGSLGAFFSNPRAYMREEQLGEAYQRGFSEGAQLAFKTAMSRSGKPSTQMAFQPKRE